MQTSVKIAVGLALAGAAFLFARKSQAATLTADPAIGVVPSMGGGSSGSAYAGSTGPSALQQVLAALSPAPAPQSIAPAPQPSYAGSTTGTAAVASAASVAAPAPAPADAWTWGYNSDRDGAAGA